MKKKNPTYIQKLLSEKITPYVLRDPSLLTQPRTDSTNLGLKSFSYLASKWWNDLDNNLKQEIMSIEEFDPYEFRSILKRWCGPKDLNTINIYV